MKFLTDENVYSHIVELLRQLGHDVIDIKELKLFGVPDEKIFELAKSEDRILITFNHKHFGNILLYPPATTSGIIIIKMPTLTVRETVIIFKNFINTITEEEIKKKLIIVEENRIRVRK